MDEIIQHYQQFREDQRLGWELGAFELARTQQIVQRHLPGAHQTVIDVGGGPGIYSLWLARLGHEVHLVDATPKHIEQARAASLAQPDHPLASAHAGDARSLPQEDDSADAVLLMGPLYHLTTREDRLLALREALRVARPRALLFAAAISRFASLVDGLARGFVDDPAFAQIVDGDLRDGQHRNPTGKLDYFTTAYFHHSDELRSEMTEAGWREVEIFAVEGIAWAARDFETRWSDPNRQEQLLDLVRRTETEPSLLGASPHLLGVARKG